MLLSLALILICGFAASGVLQKLRLPPLLGMMVVGMVLGPHGLGLIDPVLLSVSPEIRQVALIVVLIRAGLSLEPRTLRRVGRPALLLCFLPSTVEIIVITLLAPVLLGIPVIQAAVLGAVLAAVSPAVVVPRMLQLTEQGYGAQQGVPQMVMTGAAVDDVYVVVLFTALLRMAQGGGFAPLSLLQVPVSILLGLLLGMAGGQLAAVVFCRFHLRDTVKVLLLLALSFLFVALEAALKPFLPVSGLLAVVTMGALLRQKARRWPGGSRSNFPRCGWGLSPCCLCWWARRSTLARWPKAALPPLALFWPGYWCARLPCCFALPGARLI